MIETAELAGESTQREVLAELERIFALPAFRTSRQCQKFLRYVVGQVLQGSDEALKERSIGTEVFGRDPAYDTGEDPVVRVRANEVRKRLAQCYADPAPHTIRIDLPPGSYRPEFHRIHSAPLDSGPALQPASTAPGHRLPRWKIWALAGLSAAVILPALAVLLSRPPTEPSLERFWGPILSASKPVLICSGHPVVYFLAPNVHRRFRDEDPQLGGAGPYILPLRPDEVLYGREVIPVPDQFVGAGNAYAAAQLTALFARKGKTSRIKFGNDITFSDLRAFPAVLLGAFSNRWTMEMTSDLRFAFEMHEGVRKVVDRSEPGKTWAIPSLAPNGHSPEDYLIVSRIFDSKSGEPIVTAAGITQYGTQAAGEFLTTESRLRSALEKAPAGWERKNLQVLLHTEVLGSTPGPPKVLAVHCW